MKIASERRFNITGDIVDEFDGRVSDFYEGFAW